MWSRHRWMHHWFERRMQRKVMRLARKLDLNAEQRADLDEVVTALSEARRAVWLSQRQTVVDVADILRNTDIRAAALQTEISESLDELKSHVDVLAERLVMLVEHLDDAQRRQLAGLIERRLHLSPAA